MSDENNTKDILQSLIKWKQDRIDWLNKWVLFLSILGLSGWILVYYLAYLLSK